MRRAYLKAPHSENNAVDTSTQSRSRISVTVPSSLPSQAEHDASRKQCFKYQLHPGTPGHDFGRALRRRQPVPNA